MSEVLNAAAARLERAISALEVKTRELKAQPRVGDDDLFAPRSADDTELRAAAMQASEALDRAAEELRTLIGSEA
ncbi:hypothetical protein [Brevundimonas sp.]|uniref:hypothetical protein n=1 Tax=Brevundimonas sp. TaxID=1871086 RepID=UPI0025D5C56D|nr:hypothetical protein [Brevundimonas sp.]